MSNQLKTLSILLEQFAICQLNPDEKIPEWAIQKPTDFFSIIKTIEELSIICPEKYVPKEIKVSTGWHCLKLEGPFDLDEPGVLASLVSPLAKAGISVFAEATYNTDYLLVNNIDKAIETLEALNHTVIQPKMN
jgi:hypothetical protein